MLRNINNEYFFNLKMNAISLPTASRPNDWDCSKAEWGDQTGDAPRASTPRRRLNFVFPLFFSSFFLSFILKIIFFWTLLKYYL